MHQAKFWRQHGGSPRFKPQTTASARGHGNYSGEINFLRISILMNTDRRRGEETLARECQVKKPVCFLRRSKVRRPWTDMRDAASAICSPFTPNNTSKEKQGFSLWEILETVPDSFSNKQTLWDLPALSTGKRHVCQHVVR